MEACSITFTLDYDVYWKCWLAYWLKEQTYLKLAMLCAIECFKARRVQRLPSASTNKQRNYLLYCAAETPGRKLTQFRCDVMTH